MASTVSTDELERRVRGTHEEPWRRREARAAAYTCPGRAPAKLALGRPAEIVKAGDVDTLSVNGVREQLQQDLGLDLQDRKPEIKEMVLRALKEVAAGNSAPPASTAVAVPATTTSGADDDLDEPDDLDDDGGRRERRRGKKAHATTTDQVSARAPPPAW